MENKLWTKRNAFWLSLACYVVIFLCWGLWLNRIGARIWFFSREWTDVCESVVIKNIIWLLPAAVCVIALRTPLRWSLRELLTKPIPWNLMLIAVCFIAVAVHTLWLLEGSGIPFFYPVFLVLALCAGVTEELLFRGILLNSQLAVLPTPVAILINSIMFVLIHYTDIMFGLSPMVMLSKRGLVIFVMSTMFSVVTTKTRCLKVPIIMHILWNTLVYIYGIY